jgi:hypothetical protein
MSGEDVLFREVVGGNTTDQRLLDRLNPGDTLELTEETVETTDPHRLDDDGEPTVSEQTQHVLVWTRAEVAEPEAETEEDEDIPVEAEADTGTGPYEGRTLKQLQALAKERGISFSGLSKDDLIDTLRA